MRDEFKITIDRALKRIKETSFSDKITDVILFGSVARGDTNEFSDVDLLLELDDSLKDDTSIRTELRSLKGGISHYCGYNLPEVDLKIRFGDSWRTTPKVFYKFILKDGKSIWNMKKTFMR